ncbi:hypothetical protein C4566_01750 [Candidatus Parcubacteria bacterium]|nr:MAG: hypothetical protein C4566_01750 [Candidatus Parcubacteria bacterium]
MKNPFNREKKNTLLPKILLALVFLSLPKIVFAAGVDGIVADFIGKAIYAGILVPLFEVLKIELWILPIIAQYNNFIGEAGVVQGWTVMRNLSNMFFIIILLIIAFATMLKMQSYGYRQLLKRFIIVAILINFSRTIVGVLIDFSQVIMLTFVNVIKGISTSSLTLALGIPNLLDNRDGTWNLVAMYALAAIMLVIVVIVVLSIIAILLMRIVTLWVLIVLSPLAFIAYTFPKTERYFGQWSEELGKNLFAGPALAFFLWLSFAIVGNGRINQSFEGANEFSEDINRASISTAATPSNMINFVIGIAILLAGIKMTQSTGVAGAAMAGAAVAYGKGAANRLGKRAAKKSAGLAGKAVSAPIKTGARLAWQGTSGEGMAKAGLSRVFRGTLGSAMAQRGPGFVQRWGQRLEAAETGRRQRKLEHASEGMEGVRDRAAYARTQGGRLGAAMQAKEMLDAGETFTPAQARSSAAALEYMNNTQDLRRLQTRVAVANDEASVTENVNKNGVDDTFSKMSFDGAVVGGRLDQGAEAAIRVFLQQDGKAQQSAVDKMSSQDKEHFTAALAAYNPATDRGLAAHPEQREIIDPSTGTLRRDSVATNRMMILANNSATHGTAALSAAAPAERDAVAEFRARTIDITSLLKMNAGTTGAPNQAFEALARNLNAEQTRQFLSRSTDDSQKEALIRVQMASGKNMSVLTKDSEAQKYITDTQIQQSFDFQVLGPTTPGTPPPATLNPAQTAKRDELAKSNLPYAEQAFSITGGLDKAAFANFILSKLTADQAAEIGPESLDKIKTELLAAATAAGGKGAALLDALREKHGIDVT